MTHFRMTWPQGRGTLNFDCYIGWTPASSVYQKKIMICRSYPNKISDISAKNVPKKISADISVPKTIFPLLSFYKMVVVFYYILVSSFLGDDNIAYNQSTHQKSSRRRDDSHKAVDGIFYDSCSTTKKGKKTWWRVKLDGWYNVTKVVIQNRADCCGKNLFKFRTCKTF